MRLQLNERAFRFSRLAAVSQFTGRKCHKQNGGSEEEQRVIEIAHSVGWPGTPRVSAQCWSPVRASEEAWLIASESNADVLQTDGQTEVITLPPWKFALVETIRIYLTTYIQYILPTIFNIFEIYVTVCTNCQLHFTI